MAEPDPSHLEDEFVPSDAVTLDVTSPGAGEESVVVDADPGLESLILQEAGSSNDQREGAETATDPESVPILLQLDQDQISKLENVLRSEEAKEMDIKGILVDQDDPEEIQEDSDQLDTSLADILAAGEAGHLRDELVEESESALSGSGEPQTSTASSPAPEKKAAGAPRDQKAPKRRSQRQIDKEMREEAEKIRLENQALMKKEKEEEEAKRLAASSSSGGLDEAEDGQDVSGNQDKGEQSVEQNQSEKKPSSPKKTIATGRPRRERRLPAHLKSGDFATSLTAIDKKKVVAGQKEPEETIVDLKDKKDKIEEAAKEKMGEDGPAKQDEEGEEEEEEDDDAGFTSEDDPERLWCICKQPHNNRFMICCDTCAEWFHGKCVGVTKSMGKDMEEAGNEWRCPQCKEKQAEVKTVKKRQELAEKLIQREDEKKKKQQQQNSSDAKSPKKPLKRSTSTASAKGKQKAEEKPKPKEKTCYMCEKTPLVGSLYCSKECISKHTEEAKTALSKDKKTSGRSSSPSGNHIMVMDPKANTILTGPSAPTETNLEKWLNDHQTYHVVMPSYSSPASKFYGSMKKKDQESRHSKPSKPSKPTLSPAEKSSLADQKYEEYKNKALKLLHDKRSNSSQESNKSHSSHSSTSSRPRKEYSTPRKTHVAKGETLPAPSTPADPKPFREKALQRIEEVLKARVAKTPGQTLSDEKLVELVKEIEEQLFRLHEKKVDHKYLAKYRSLLFNLKDEKNDLFLGVISRKVSPHQLVNMSPEDMANKELQQWREKELKHEIESIKKTELDHLAHGSKFLVKTHKGEVVKEERQDVGEVKLPDDVIDLKKKESFDDWGRKTWDHGHHSFESQCDVCTGKKTVDEFIVAKEKRKKIKEERKRKEKERREKDKKHSSRHHSSHRSHHKSSSSSSKEKSSSDKDRSKEKTSDHKSNSSSSSSSRHKHSSRDKEKHRHHGRRDRKDSKDEHNKSKSQVDSSKEKNAKKEESPAATDFPDLDEKEEQLRQKEFSEKMAKAEQILKEFKDSQAIPIVPKEANEEDSEDIEEAPISPEEAKEDESAGGAGESSSTPVEVSSTVHITTPESDVYDKDARGAGPSVWSGHIDMPDVATFGVAAKAVSGTTDYLTEDLRDTLKIIGRIAPKTVWDYIAQVVATQAKEILIVRLLPSSDDEKAAYASFYAYLQERQRFGVVGNASATVKDCYILPLGPNDKLHECLMPLDGPGLGTGERADMLLGLVVRSKRKRSRPLQTELNTIKQKQQTVRGGTPPLPRGDSATTKPSKEAEEVEYDPAMAGAETLSESSSQSPADDDDEVYDPESAFQDQEEVPPAKKRRTDGLPQFSPPHDGDKRQELEALNQKIRKEREELASLQDTKDGKSHSKGPVSSSIGPAPVKGFQGLPANIASVLFGKNAEAQNKSSAEASKKKSNLSAMSDADLLAKAQEMEAPASTKSDPRSRPAAKQSLASGAPPHHSYFAEPPPPIMANYSDPNWMNTGPPPLPPVNFNTPPPQRPHLQVSQPGSSQQGPWMRGYEPGSSSSGGPWSHSKPSTSTGGGDQDWRGENRHHDARERRGSGERLDSRENRGHHRDRRRDSRDSRDRRDRDYRDRSDDRHRRHSRN